ncbi:hypothetical protein CFC21_099111 [Triticum aestivum]|uniref:BTB domain-containing protein n=2 Tax=Triticum aestivum TaxID=4565 RepID=A0A3B6RNG2_WHEAT|nr:BTB/POZ and MATH domain-containing protein 3-like [Triticum dicoccoides]KAF7097275.1 hypothetical protein CFC21_099111 [Triticum aestivum]
MAASPSASPAPTGARVRDTMSRHSTVLVRGTHQFSIVGFSLHQRAGVGNFIRSDAFEVGGHSWAIRCYPAGNREEEEGYLSLYLEVLSTPALEKTTVKYSFEINGPAGTSPLLAQPCAWDDFTTDNISWGYKKYVKVDSLDSRYLRNDCLVVRCTVEVQESKTGATTSSSIAVPPSGIRQDLARLLDSKRGADVTFQVGGNDYAAHKAVVAMRSPVFCAQFFGALADKPGSRHVRIHDMKPAAFEAVLHFIYTDALPPVFKDDSKQSHREMMCDWLAAADRYGLERMRLLCESALHETIDVENAAWTLELADRHHCPQLKAFCVDYIVSPGVLTDVMATEGYKQLKTNCPSLLVDVLEKLTWK